MALPRILVSVLGVMAVLGFASAKAEDPPPPDVVDEARLRERYVIEASAETLLAAMLGMGETLPGGCRLGNGKIERTFVVGTYTCGNEQVVLQLLHPESAPSGAVRTERLAVSVTSGTPPAGLVAAVADRVRAREAEFKWTEVEGGKLPRRRWPLVWAVAGGAAAMLAFWTLRRLVVRRRRPA
jgi:hypothetical protein